MYRNEAEIKTPKKTTLLRNDGSKERQERLPYICFMCNRYREVFLCFFPPSFYSSVILLVFIPALFSSLLPVHPYLKCSFAETFLLYSFCCFKWACKLIFIKPLSRYMYSLYYSPQNTVSADIHNLCTCICKFSFLC